MKGILKNKKGISNVIGYLFSFAIASMVMFTSVLITRNIMDETASRVGDLQAQSIANRVADAVLEAAAVGISISPEEYRKTLDLPIYIANRDYYVEITEKFVYVNTSDGVITKRSPTYGADKFGIGIDNTRIYAGNKIDITVKRSDYVYKLDFGTGTSTSHSPVEAGYYRVTNNSSPDLPWADEGLGYQARVPILIDNDSPEELVDVPVPIVLNPLNFDYSMANVTIDSSSTVRSDLAFYDLSEQVFSRISISPSAWDPSWFYTYYDATSTAEEVTVSILSISGGYDVSYIDADTVKLRRVGNQGSAASCVDWSVSQGVGTAVFDGKEVLEVLEDGRHYLKNPSYIVEVFGLLKNGQEFTGSQEISIENAVYVKRSQSQYPDGGEIQEKIDDAPAGSTIFIESSVQVYKENLVINKQVNLIGRSQSGVKITTRLTTGHNIILITHDNINIDSLTIQQAPINRDGIHIENANHINITNCLIRNCMNGINIKNSADIGIFNCETRSMSGHTNPDQNEEEGSGIKIENSQEIRITDCTSYANNNDYGSGFRVVDDSSHVTFIRCIAHDHTAKEADGFYIADSSYVTLISCTSEDNRGEQSQGVRIINSNNCEILDSTIRNNNGFGSDGIRIDVESLSGKLSHDNLIKNCKIYGNNNVAGEGCGVNIRGTGALNDNSNNRVEDCEIYNNFFGVLIVGMHHLEAPNRGNKIINSDIYNNIDHGIKIRKNFGGGICNNHSIIGCNIYNNGITETGKPGSGISIWASAGNIIEGCNIFDNGDHGLELRGALVGSGVFYWSHLNTIRYNNFYTNGRSNSSGTGVFIDGGKLGDGFMGCTQNNINNNNFAHDYPYPRNCPEYNSKYAIDNYNWLSDDLKNDWDNNFWDNAQFSSFGNYFIPNLDMNNNYINNDSNPMTDRHTDTPDYIIVSPSSSVISGSVTIRGTAYTSDSRVKMFSPLKNHGGEEYMTVDPKCDESKPSTWQIDRMFIKFDISQIIPPGSTVTSAYLYIYYRDWWSNGNNPVNRIHDCHRATGAWREYEITWQNQPSHSSVKTSSFIPSPLGDTEKWKSWNVINDVQNFVKNYNAPGQLINHGWAIKDSSEYTNDNYAAFYDSTEKGGNTHQPRLVITFTPPAGDSGPYYHPTSIAQAVENVMKGGTILLKEGTYEENNIVINKALTLKGRGEREDVIIDGGGTGNVIKINTNDKNVFIESLTITNGSTGIYMQKVAGWISFNPINITNCVIYGNNQDGIYSDLPDVNIKNCYIHSNYVAGIHLESNRNTILNTNISNNDIGIYLENSHNNILNLLNIEGNNKGIALTSSRTNLIENCVLKENEYSGIELQNSGQSTVFKNRIINCEIVGTGSSGFSRGIYLHSNSRHNNITNCDISKNNRGAINISDSNYNKITKCMIHDNSNYSVYLTGGSNNNKIYHNKFMNNHNPLRTDAFDDGNNNQWDNGYPSGGNLWDKYYDASQGAFDYSSGLNQDQPGSDGIADDPYEIDPGNNYDYYPFCRTPIDIKYYIDHWNPKGESVIFLNMDIPSRSSKYVYMYYGSKEPAVIRSMEDVTVFFDNFSSFNTDVWHNSDDFTPTDGILSIPENNYILSKGDISFPIIPGITPPALHDNQKTISHSMYIVEAKMNISSNAKGELDIMCWPWYEYPVPMDPPPPGYFISVDNVNNFFNISNNHGIMSDFQLHDCNTTIPPLDDWMRLRTYIYRSHEKYNAQGDTFESKTAHVKGIIYDNNSYANKGSVSHLDGIYKTAGSPNWNDLFHLSTGLKIGSGAGEVQVDWIRVMKAPILPPTVTIGAMESARYGWDAEVVAGNYIPTSGFDNPFIPGPLLRDYNNGSESATFVIWDLPAGEYTVTLTMGRVDSECTETTVTFKDNNNNNLGSLTLPATDNGSFVTRSKTINWGGGNLEIQFSAKTNEQWTINAMTIEKGRRGVKVDYA
jgi:parallel beta-helix repeat protein